VLAALRLGKTIEAIRLLRESSGLGLKEAKDAIDHHLRGNPRTAHAPAKVATLPAVVADAMRKGNKVEAIRLLRESTGLGLKEAKSAVEEFSEQSALLPQERAPGEVPKSRIGPWVVAVVALVALLAYFVIRRSGF
jgi:ribosomal protein L7/L12